MSEPSVLDVPGIGLGPASQVPVGEGRLFEVGSRTVAVFRLRDGGFRATDPWCPHRGGPLADGLVGAGTVTCPFHGYRFDLSSGCAVGHDCPPIATYPVSLDAAGELRLHVEGVLRD
ncbi:MAG TPA: Rieske 2Fe-2S domain-containing protein [Luteitalea sp.]|nr:Rieske 2Fe-2S domain-containing protein [Luteitalea sp.]